MTTYTNNPSGYANLNQTWVPQSKYNLDTSVKPTEVTENFGAFSISAAVRPSNCSSCSSKNEYMNPWYRGDDVGTGIW